MSLIRDYKEIKFYRPKYGSYNSGGRVPSYIGATDAKNWLSVVNVQ